MSTLLIVGALVAVLSWLGTRLYLRYALAHGILDIPNERSSHRAPTPRGGGLAIVLACVLGLAALGAYGVIGRPELLALLGGGVLVAAIGYVDDHRPLPARWRLPGHFAAAIWVVASLGARAGFPFTDPVLHAGAVGDLIAVLYVVWMINLVNFMDGIDGIASIEAITVGLGGWLLAMAAAGSASVGAGAFILVAACAGFLRYNWPPARVFMGDAGSGFIGVTLATLSLRAGQDSLTHFWAWVILAVVFVADATLTLMRRIARGDRLSQAHRSHAYQHAALRLGAHGPVTAAVAAINLVWLLPLAMMVGSGRVSPLVGGAAAYLPLLAGALALGAGSARLPRLPR